MSNNLMIPLIPAVLSLLFAATILIILVSVVVRVLRSRNRGIYLGIAAFGLLGLFLLGALFAVRVGSVPQVRSSQLTGGYNSSPSQLQGDGIDISAERQRFEVRKGGKRIVVSPQGMSITSGDGRGGQLDMPGMSLSTDSGAGGSLKQSKPGVAPANAGAENGEEPLLAQLYERSVELATSQPSRESQTVSNLQDKLRAAAEQARRVLASEPQRADVREKLQRLEMLSQKLQINQTGCADTAKRLEEARRKFEKLRVDAADGVRGGVQGADAALRQAQLMLEAEQTRAAATQEALARSAKEAEVLVQSMGASGNGMPAGFPAVPSVPAIAGMGTSALSTMPALPPIPSLPPMQAAVPAAQAPRAAFRPAEVQIPPGMVIGEPAMSSVASGPKTYPTRISAALALAKKVLGRQLAKAQCPLLKVSISGDDPVVVSEMVRRLPQEAQGITGWDHPKVAKAADDITREPAPPEDEIRIDVRIQVNPGMTVDQGGRVDLVMRSSDGSISTSAPYSDKIPVPAARTPTASGSSKTPSDVSSAPGTVVGQPWTRSDQHPFEPSIYPTRVSAAMCLAKRMLREYLTKMTADQGGLSTLSISGNDPDVVYELIRRLPTEAGKIPGWGCVNVVPAQGTTAQPGPGEISFQVAVQVNPGMTADQGGRVALTMRGGHSEVTYNAEYVDGRWSEEFQKWVQQHPGHNWILATSEQLCTSEQAAIEQARLVAVKELEKRVEGYIRQQGGVYNYSSQELERRINDELRDGGIPVQQFTQQFQRPYGDVWRCAVLVDASPNSLQQIAAKYCGAMQRERVHSKRLLVSVAALLLIIIGVYLLLNAATRGYYAWSIRVMLLVVLGVGVWFAMKF